VTIKLLARPMTGRVAVKSGIKSAGDVRSEAR